jgi:hypothetical protein
MLRSRVQGVTGAVGVAVSIAHGLGATLDAWNVVELEAIGRGRTYVIPASVGPVTLSVRNSIGTAISLEVFCWIYQGRLY